MFASKKEDQSMKPGVRHILEPRNGDVHNAYQ